MSILLNHHRLHLSLLSLLSLIPLVLILVVDFSQELIQHQDLIDRRVPLIMKVTRAILGTPTTGQVTADLARLAG